MNKHIFELCGFSSCLECNFNTNSSEQFYAKFFPFFFLLNYVPFIVNEKSKWQKTKIG